MLADAKGGSKSEAEDVRTQVDAGWRVLRCFERLHDYLLLCEKAAPIRMELVAQLVDQLDKSPAQARALQRSKSKAGLRGAQRLNDLAQAVRDVQKLDVEEVLMFALHSRRRFECGPIQGRSAVEALKTGIDGIEAPAQSMKSRSPTRYYRLFSATLYLSTFGNFDERRTAIDAAAHEIGLLEATLGESDDVPSRASKSRFSPRPKHIDVLRALQDEGATSATTSMNPRSIALKVAAIRGSGLKPAGTGKTRSSSGALRDTLRDLRVAAWLGVGKAPIGGYWLLSPAIEWLRKNG